MKPTICHISTFGPTQCGIATYVSDLIASLSNWDAIAARMMFSADPVSSEGYTSSLALTVDTCSPEQYATFATTINRSDCDVVSLQHEFGIYGSDDGQGVVSLVEAIRKPIITTLHTVAPQLSRRRVEILQALARHSRRLILLSPEDRLILASLVQCSTNQTEVIRHGVPDIRFAYPMGSAIRRRLNCPTVFVSVGHIRPSKGYHLALQALALFKKVRPDFRYLILGRPQPQYDSGAACRDEMSVLIERLGLRSHVIWVEDYLPLPRLVEYINAADLGLVTYTEQDQASSGVVPLLLAAGRPVVATPFTFALRMASQTPGVHIAKSQRPEDICDEILKATADAAALRTEMKGSHGAMRAHTWDRVGELYDRVFRACLGYEPISSLAS